jgi:hypothetical protein
VGRGYRQKTGDGRQEKRRRNIRTLESVRKRIS